MAFAIEQRDHDGVHALAAAGRLDPRAARELEQALAKCLNEGRRSLLLDLSRLEHIDGTGLRVLLTADERLEALGGRLALCALHPNVRKVFDVFLPRRLVVLDSRAEALRWLEKSVRVARVARLAGSLLRQNEPGRPERRYARLSPDTERLELAARLLGLVTDEAPPPRLDSPGLSAAR